MTDLLSVELFGEDEIESCGEDAEEIGSCGEEADDAEDTTKKKVGAKRKREASDKHTRTAPTFSQLRRAAAQTSARRWVALQPRPAAQTKDPPKELRGLRVATDGWTRFRDGFTLSVHTTLDGAETKVVRVIRPYVPGSDDVVGFDFIKERLGLPSGKAVMWADEVGGSWLASRDMSRFKDMDTLLNDGSLLPFADDKAFWRRIWHVVLFRFALLGSGQQTSMSDIYIDVKSNEATSIENTTKHRAYVKKAGGDAGLARETAKREMQGAAQLMHKDTPTEIIDWLDAWRTESYTSRILDEWTDTLENKCDNKYKRGMAPRIAHLRTHFAHCTPLLS
jgi:hypothetical protein